MKPRALFAACLFSFQLLHAAHAETPKLVVALLVDQLRYDYLERFYPQLAPNGFRLLMDKGAFLTFAQYNYAPTVTGPGHASFLSGSTPSAHGIIGNDWFDTRTRKSLNCVSDPDVEGVGAAGTGGKRSPRNFTGSNIADEMRLRFHSKVVGVSLKDRGAILPAGKRPNGAFWFDSASGNFITSTYYMQELPEWVRAFNEKKRPAAFVGQTWQRLLDPSQYGWPDAAAGEGMFSGEKAPVFDHAIRPSPTEGFETIVPTPFGNQLLAEFALAALDGERLGSGPQPDLLTVSFSSTDAAGHIFGPYSHEEQDIILRLDRQLADFFTQLDKKVGLSHVAIVLTADHGVAPTPEFAQEQGLDGQRSDTGGILGELSAKLAEQFGNVKILLTPRIWDGNLYFDHASLKENKIQAEEVALFIRNWALSTGKFQAAFTRSQLLDGRAPGIVGLRVLNGFHAERSGDVVLVGKPFQIPGGPKSGTTHGSPYSYDTHVPVLFYGSQFKPGRYADEFAITDIAPTLSAALHMNEPALCMGKPLVKVLAGQGPAPAPSPTPKR